MSFSGGGEEDVKGGDDGCGGGDLVQKDSVAEVLLVYCQEKCTTEGFLEVNSVE
jgi:hypothetical protein